MNETAMPNRMLQGKNMYNKEERTTQVGMVEKGEREG
jgi:hypothetical protein